MKFSKTDKLVFEGWKGWLKLYGMWTIPALIASNTRNLTGLYSDPGEVWYVVFLHQVWVWYLWASLSPIIYKISAKYSILSPRWYIGLTLHLPVAILSAIIVSMLYGIIRTIAYELPIEEAFVGDVMSNYALGRHQNNIVIYGLTVIAMHVIYLNRINVKREQQSSELLLRESKMESQLNIARLNTLVLQLHPHFMCNSLNSVASLIADGSPKNAYRTVTQLGGLLHTFLENSQHQYIYLREEILSVRRYLDIEQIRFPKRLRSDFHINSDCADILVPNMILMPLVENVIKHAVAKSTKETILRLNAEIMDQRLVLEVMDNGPGVRDISHVFSKPGIGLKNIRDRLRLLYGDKQDLEILDAESAGTIVRITIPIQQRIALSE